VHAQVQYDAFASGGGFAAQAPSAAAAAAAAASTKQKESTLSLRSVTVRQLLEQAPNDNKKKVLSLLPPLRDVKLIALVLSCTRHETHLVLQVEDGTGHMEITYYVDVDAEADADADAAAAAAAALPVVVDQYAEIWGRLSFRGEVPIVVAFQLRPLDDHNKLTCHLLSCILDHKRATQGLHPPRRHLDPQQMSTSASSAAAAGSSSGTADAIFRRRFLACIRSDKNAQSDHGCSLEDVAHRMGNGVTHAQLLSVAEELCVIGELYSTVDEDHYKSTTTT